MRRTSLQVIADLLEAHDPRVKEAFLDAVQDISDNIPIGRLTEAIERGNLQQALDLINLDEAAFEPVLDALRDAYTDGGRDTGRIISGLRTPSGVVTAFRFSVRNTAAESFLRTQSSQFITRITNAQREAVQSVLTEGLIRGDNPRRTALDIAGRIDRATSNRREGGIIGLSPRDVTAVNNARRQLSSSNPADLRAYLSRSNNTRDRRFDRTVNRAIAEGRPLTASQIDRIVSRYSDGLLRLRADSISRTETVRALNGAQYEAYRQAIESGTVDARAITKRWVSAGDLRVRITHVTLNNTAIPFDGIFTTSRGSSLRFPLDTELGALAADIIQCRCIVEYRIDFTRGVT